MASEYNLDETISFPIKLFDKFCDGYYIVVAPNNPNWIVLNENEYKLFQFLREGLSIRKSLENYYKKYCQNEADCLSLMTGLLRQIDDVDFKNNAVISAEEKIESITKKVHIGTTNGCNMHCPHCYMSAGTKQLEIIDLSKTIKLVSELHEIYGELEIVVSGGEPLTYSHIEDLLKGLKGNHIILFTNGSLISEKNIDVICECCNEIQISFEAVSKKSYEAIRGMNYKKVLHSVELLKAREKRIVLAVTILPSTLIDIKDNLIKFVKKINYDNLEIRLSDEIEMAGNALSLDISGFDKDYSKKIVINLVKELEELGCVVKATDIRNTKFTNCGIGTNIVINYDGKIYPCHKFSSYALKIGTDTKDVINEFNRLNDETSNDNMLKCQTCELRYICSGGCRIDNFNTAGNMTKPICDEKYKETQYRKLLNDYKMYREGR